MNLLTTLLTRLVNSVRIPMDTLRKIVPVLVEKGLLEEIGKKDDSRTFKLNENSDLARSLRN